MPYVSVGIKAIKKKKKKKIILIYIEIFLITFIVFCFFNYFIHISKYGKKVILTLGIKGCCGHAYIFLIRKQKQNDIANDRRSVCCPSANLRYKATQDRIKIIDCVFFLYKILGIETDIQPNRMQIHEAKGDSVD